MKKSLRQLLLGVLAVVMVLLLCVTAFAEDESQERKLSMNTEVISIINSQLSDSEKAALKDADISELVIDNQNMPVVPVIRVFNELFFAEIGEPLDTLLATVKSYGDEAKFTEYVVLDSTPYLIRMHRSAPDSKVSVGMISYTSTVPRYIADIMMLSEFPDIRNGCKLEGVYCFDATTSHQGSAVYLKTDMGVYVKYYEDLTSEALVFSEEEFRVRATAYYNYLISHENNYNENGEALGGNKVSFASFTRSNHANLSKKTENLIPIVILLVSSISLVIGILAVLTIKRKKLYAKDKK